jgi:choline-sulfatase
LAGAGVETPDRFDALPGRSLFDIAAEPDDETRIVFSEYHGAAATSGAYMLRDGRYKYIHYAGYEPEFYDLDSDPEEMSNLAVKSEFQTVVAQYEKHLRDMVDPEAVNARALADQAAMIEGYGGVEKMLGKGVIANTPVPGGP